jgi:multidrug efflux pump
LTEYRPDDADDEVDIRVRFPNSERNLGQFDQLRISTPRGMIPISNFVTLQPAPKNATLRRVDARRTIAIKADVVDALLPDAQLKELQKNDLCGRAGSYG